MTSSLDTLPGLSDRDREWLTSLGESQTVIANTCLIQEGKGGDRLFLLTSGTCGMVVTGAQGRQEIAQRQAGEFLDLIALLTGRPATTGAIALTQATLLSIPQTQLLQRLKQDRGLAARFYRAIAIALSSQLRQVSGLLVRSRTTTDYPLRKALVVFAELHDSDVDWMVKVGQAEQLPTETVLIRQGESADAIYLLLQGTLIVSIAVAVDGTPTTKDIATLATGEIVGEMSFIDAQPPSATVRASENALVLALPRDQISLRLQQDEGFASRFYRAIAIVLADRLQDRLIRHGYACPPYDEEQPLDEEIEYEDELDTTVLGNVALAGARFDWLLRQIRHQR